MENSFRIFPIVLSIFFNGAGIVRADDVTGKYDDGILISQPVFITWLLITGILLVAFVAGLIISLYERKNLKTEIYVLEQTVEKKVQEIIAMRKKQRKAKSTTTSTEKSMDPMEVTAPGILDTVDVKDEQEEKKKKEMSKEKKEKTETLEYLETETEQDYGRKKKKKNTTTWSEVLDDWEDDKTTTATKPVTKEKGSIKKVAPIKKKKRISNSKKAKNSVTATEGTTEDPLDKSRMRDSTMESIATAEVNMISMKAYK